MGLQGSTGALQALPLDASGYLLVNVAVGGGGGGGGSNAAASQTGLPVPSYADYTGWNSGGNLVGASLAAALPVQPGTGATFPVSGTFWQATQPVSIATLPAISGTVAVSNFPASQAVSGTVTANQGTSPWVVSGTVNVGTRGWTLSSGTDSVAAVQSGTWNIGSITTLPAITGAVSVSNFPVTQPVSGTVAVSNFPASQAVTGTFWQATQPVSIAATVNTSDNHTTAAAPISVRLTDGTSFYTASGGGGGGANAAAGLTGSAVPASADYQGWNNGGVLTGASPTAPMPVAQSGTNFLFSSVNSTTAQLAAGAVFPGAIETILSQTQISMLLESDQPGVLVVNQYITATDPFPVSSYTYQTIAGQGFSQAIKANGNYAQVIFTNNGQKNTTQLNINTYYGTIQESVQVGATSNQVTGLPDTLENGDNFNDFDAPTGNATGSASTGLIGAEAYPRFFDGINWQRQRGQIDLGLRVYDSTVIDLLTQIIKELRVHSFQMQQYGNTTDAADIRDDPNLLN